MTELNTSVVARPIGTGLRLDLAAAAVGRRAGAIVPLLVLVVGWEATSRSGIVTPFLLPPISAVLERVWQDALSGELAVNLGLTLFRSLVGFAIAGVGGVVLGILMTRQKLVRWFFDPTRDGLTKKSARRAANGVALAPKTSLKSRRRHSTKKIQLCSTGY